MKKYHVVCMCRLPGVNYTTEKHCSIRHHWTNSMKYALDTIKDYMEMEGTFEVRLREEKSSEDKDDVEYDET